MKYPKVQAFKIVYLGADLRKAANQSYQQIESATGIARSTLCKWEHGLAIPSLMQLAILADYFHVNWEELVEVMRCE